MKHSIILLLLFQFLFTLIVKGQNGININYLSNNLHHQNKSAFLQRDGDNTLNPSFSLTLCGLNYVQSSAMITPRYTNTPGVGLPVDLNISGIPTCAVIEKAYLYWIVSASSIDQSFTINGNAGNGVLIGSGPDKCWSLGATRNFRADVTTEINGNGLYNIDFGYGETPVDGASLLVIYSDPTQFYEGTIMINDGCIVNTAGDTVTYPMTGFTICSPPISSNSFVISSDFQDNGGPDHFIQVGNNLDTFPNLFFNFDVLTPTIYPGIDTLLYSCFPSDGDCYAIISMGLYYQTNCNGCGNTSSPLTLSFTQTMDTCLNCVATAEILASGGTGSYNYHWFPNPNMGQGTSSASGLCFGNYSVTVSDGACNSGNVIISIDSLGNQPNTSILFVDTLCITSTNQNLIAIESGGIWSGSGISDSVTGEFNPSLAGVGSSYVYYSIVNGGCSNTDSILITVMDVPTSQFSFNQQIDTVEFINTSINGNNFFWDFGDGDSSLSVNPTHIYSLNGSYFVCLTVDNSFCFDTTCDTIFVNGLGIENLILNPTAIYPNPTSGWVHFVLGDEVSSIEVFDVNGKWIKSINSENQVFDFYLGGLSNGIYFIHLLRKNQIEVIPIEMVK